MIEAENQRRLAAAKQLGRAPQLVTMINDCCLAFCVLVMNDGSDCGGGGGGGGGGSAIKAPRSTGKTRKAVRAAGSSGSSGSSNDGSRGSMRLLDLVTDGHATSCIVTQDAHKHLGTDKGVSTVRAASNHTPKAPQRLCFPLGCSHEKKTWT